MYHYGAGTNVGNVRDNNEDSLVCAPDNGLWIVADGMGGLGFGEVASAISTYTVTNMIRDGHGVNQAIEVAHRNIKEYAETDGLGTNMGTTIVLLLSQGSLYNIFWVGDSRAYLLDKGAMSQVTTDHSLVQSLIEQGELTREEAETDPRKNAVTRALGVQELDTVRADSISERWQPGQKMLLCSDGLTDCVSDANIEKIMLEGGEDQEIVDNLIEAALEGGGKDNVTIVVVSAPATAKTLDTDTHVPSDTAHGGDDTHIPGTDDTKRRTNDSESHGKLTQLALNMTDPEQQTLNIRQGDPKVNGESDEALSANSHRRDAFANDGNAEAVVTKQAKWSNIWGAIAASLLIAVAFMSLKPSETTAHLSRNFVGDSLQPAAPIKRNLPELDFATKPTQLQVGLYQHLPGAESKQSELTLLGLAPHIVKRDTQEGIRYVVVISPADETDHQQALATLQANNLNYFHTKFHATFHTTRHGT